MAILKKILILRSKLIRKNIKSQPKGVDYPSPKITKSNDLHQIDAVCPRCLKDDGFFIL